MNVQIDKAGRIALPKVVREHLGLRAGSGLELEEVSGGVVLRPIARKPSLVKKGRFLVHTGELPPGYDILESIDDEREDRIRKIWGL